MAFHLFSNRFTRQTCPKLIKIRDVLVIFIDITNSQALIKTLGECVAYANTFNLFKRLQASAVCFGLYTLKTNGDQIVLVSHNCYTATSPFRDNYEKATAAFSFAHHAHSVANEIAQESTSDIKLRIGIAQGNAFLSNAAPHLQHGDIWGKTINKAAMLEQYTVPGSTALCTTAFNYLPKACKDVCSNHTFSTKSGGLDAKVVVDAASTLIDIKLRAFNNKLSPPFSSLAAITCAQGGKLRPFH
jgi:class 3 adenylate cyclase